MKSKHGIVTILHASIQMMDYVEKVSTQVVHLPLHVCITDVLYSLKTTAQRVQLHCIGQLFLALALELHITVESLINDTK